jgi:hypothetical protein
MIKNYLRPKINAPFTDPMYCGTDLYAALARSQQKLSFSNSHKLSQNFDELSPRKARLPQINIPKNTQSNYYTAQKHARTIANMSSVGIGLSPSTQNLNGPSNSPTKPRSTLNPLKKIASGLLPARITTGSKYQDRLKNQGAQGFNIDVHSPVHLSSIAKLSTLDGHVRRQITKSVSEITRWENEAQE